MSKDNIDFDKHGHCVVCHEDMQYTEIIDGKPTVRLSPLYDETEYMLNDGSKMRVAICKPCKRTLKDDDEEKKRVMDCVFKGWKHELQKYSHWDTKKKDDYLKKYSKRKIVTRASDVEPDVLSKKLKKFKEKKK